MTQDEIARRIREDISRIAGVPPAAITDAAAFQHDLGLDSLSLLELVVHLEFAFRIKVPEGDMAALTSVAATAEYVHARVAAAT